MVECRSQRHSTTKFVLSGSDGLLDADIRLRGRVLSDVIRAQTGVSTFELIERVRRASVSSRMMGRKPADELSIALRDLTANWALYRAEIDLVQAAQHPQPLPLPRPAERSPGRAAAAIPGR